MISGEMPKSAEKVFLTSSRSKSEKAGTSSLLIPAACKSTSGFHSVAEAEAWLSGKGRSVA